MLVSELLFNTLEDVTKDDFETFKWYLTQNVFEDCQPIPRSRVENASRASIVTKMIESYNEDLAVKVTVEILRKQGLNALADKLENICGEKGTPASSSSSTSAVTPPTAVAAAAVLAQGGSVIIAPTLSSGTTGSWNITIHKP